MRKFPPEQPSDGNFRFDPMTREVWRQGRTTRLEPKAAKVLRALLESDGAVSRASLLDHCWTAGTGSDEALTQAIAQIRKALADDPTMPCYVATIPRYGYRWIYSPVPRAAAPPARSLSARRWTPAVAAVLLVTGALGGLFLASLARIDTETVTVIRKADSKEITTRRRASQPRWFAPGTAATP